jgi:hypothetical protein
VTIVNLQLICSEIEVRELQNGLVSQTWPFTIETGDIKELMSNMGDTPGPRADPAMSVYKGTYMIRALERARGKTRNLLKLAPSATGKSHMALKSLTTRQSDFLNRWSPFRNSIEYSIWVCSRIIAN